MVFTNWILVCFLMGALVSPISLVYTNGIITALYFRLGT